MSIERLDQFTYELRHNPNCPSPFLIVTCGDGGMIGRAGNLFSYGKTLDEAVTTALEAIDQHTNYRAHLIRLRVAAEAERRVRGIVWA